jgi:hypothetical protein
MHPCTTPTHNSETPLDPSAYHPARGTLFESRRPQMTLRPDNEPLATSTSRSCFQNAYCRRFPGHIGGEKREVAAFQRAVARRWRLITSEISKYFQDDAHPTAESLCDAKTHSAATKGSGFETPSTACEHVVGSLQVYVSKMECGGSLRDGPPNAVPIWLKH